jgi:hypothetical protein
LCQFQYRVTSQAQVVNVLGEPDRQMTDTRTADLGYDCGSESTSFHFIDGVLRGVARNTTGASSPLPDCLDAPTG